MRGEKTAGMNDVKPKPGPCSYIAVVRLLIEAVVDLLLLPFRFAGFLVMRRSIGSRIRKMITDGAVSSGKE